MTNEPPPPTPLTAWAFTCWPWKTLTHDGDFNAHLSAWTIAATPDGTLLLSARVDGPDKAEALTVFGRVGWEILRRRPTDQLPRLDFGTPGRTALRWQVCGAWVELWHDETPDDPAGFPDPYALCPCQFHQAKRQGIDFADSCQPAKEALAA